MLVVLDGFGLGQEPDADAIAAARMPRWRTLLGEWPHTRLEASGEAVGLPFGQMGNSEVGHLNLGSGQPVLQDLPRIDAAIADGSFARNPVLVAAAERAAERARQPERRLHVITLIGPGGVHANDRHAVALAALARAHGAQDLVVHAILDGRDTPPRSADGFLPDFERRLHAAHPGARIATVGGRYFAMDRDRRWERVERAWQAIVNGLGLAAPAAATAIAQAYARDEDDEFVQPTVIATVDGSIRDGDVLVHANFRADRARELTHAFVDGEDFTGFERGDRPTGLTVVTMTEYEQGLPVAVAFPPLVVPCLAGHVSGLGMRQFHVAETEKYAHVTYFFNGGAEASWPGEDRLLVPSPHVATYDLRPQMSAGGVTDALVGAIVEGRYDFIVANYANADMVGHTGDWDATVAALEFLDGCIGRVADAALALPDALLLITADHGNADLMRDDAGGPVTAHSMNAVPLLIAGRAARGIRLRPGVLADVAPTLLALAGLPSMPSATGRSLAAGSRVVLSSRSSRRSPE